MLVIGQYVRAVLAEGIAAALPVVEGFGPELERNGIVIQLRPVPQTFVLEDFWGNEHICHLNGAVVVDPGTLDPFLHYWTVTRAAELNPLSL